MSVSNPNRDGFVQTQKRLLSSQSSLPPNNCPRLPWMCLTGEWTIQPMRHTCTEALPCTSPPEVEFDVLIRGSPDLPGKGAGLSIGHPGWGANWPILWRGGYFSLLYFSTLMGHRVSAASQNRLELRFLFQSLKNWMYVLPTVHYVYAYFLLSGEVQ